MTWLIFGGIVVTAAVVLLVFRAFSGRGGKSVRLGYHKRDFLFSPEEHLFYAALKQAIAEDYEIFGKMRVRDIVSPWPPFLRGRQRQEFETIGDLYFTFILCDKANLSVACVVQMREQVLAGKKTTRPPDLLQPICHAAGLPFVVFEAAPLHDVHDIKEAIAAAVRKEPRYLTEMDGRKEPRISRLDNMKL